MKQDKNRLAQIKKTNETKPRSHVRTHGIPPDDCECIAYRAYTVTYITSWEDSPHYFDYVAVVSPWQQKTG